MFLVAALSEPETITLDRHVTSIRNRTLAAFSVHSFGQEIYHPKVGSHTSRRYCTLYIKTGDTVRTLYIKTGDTVHFTYRQEILYTYIHTGDTVHFTYRQEILYTLNKDRRYCIHLHTDRRYCTLYIQTGDTGTLYIQTGDTVHFT